MAARGRIARWWRRHLGYPVEAVAAYVLYGLAAALTPERASAFGGWIGRRLGPRLPASRRALRNIERALPETTPAERHAILCGMWDNLGRVLAEYPHLPALWDSGRVEVVGAETIQDLSRSHRPGLLLAAHLGNWELLSLSASRLGFGPGLTLVYRRLNNPLVDRLIAHARRPFAARLVPKGRDGAREILAALRQGGTVAMMVDQKMNDGIPVPFFGRDAMTAPAIAQLALKFDCPLIPARIERLGGTRFRITIMPPLELPRSGDRNTDIGDLMIRINRLIESWVREQPAQWLWLHRRWPD